MEYPGFIAEWSFMYGKGSIKKLVFPPLFLPSKKWKKILSNQYFGKRNIVQIGHIILVDCLKVNRLSFGSTHLHVILLQRYKC